jgi:hypothetical protein
MPESRLVRARFLALWLDGDGRYVGSQLNPYNRMRRP